MKIFIFATLKEALPSIKKFNCQMIGENLFRFTHGLLAISGIGSLAALKAVLQFGNEADEILNAGVAGALNSHLKFDQICEISSVGKFLPDDPIAHQAFPPLAVQNKGLKLVTSDFPIHEKVLSQKLSTNWDLIDMEGYGVAFGAKALGKPFRLIKIVSDFASEGGREMILKNLERQAILLSEIINV